MKEISKDKSTLRKLFSQQSKKKVTTHLDEDMKESKKGIKEDKKLKGFLKRFK